MKIFSFNKVKIFFGDSSTSPFKISEFRESKKSKLSLNILAKKLPKNTYFLKQTHSNNGLVFKKNKKILFNSLSSDGDYIISDIKENKIGVLTADCLPVVFYDSESHVSAVAHAGWRGSLANILFKVINDLKENFNTNINNLHIWFGPSAGKCCYEVSSDFLNTVLEKKLLSEKITNNCFENLSFDNKNYKKQVKFDISRYNYEILLMNGILRHNINIEQNLCTICNKQFCSYRRDGINSGVQITSILLK